MIFKGVTTLFKHRDKKIAEQRIASVLEVYRNIVTWPMWTDARTKDS